MINLTKEQITETLERLRDYSDYRYYHTESPKALKTNKVKHLGVEFTITVDKEGFIIIEITGTDIKGKYEFKIERDTSEGLVNIEYFTKIVNKYEIPAERIKWFEEVSICVLSLLQRIVAFSFFARIQPETIEGLTNDLIQCNKNE